MKDEIKEILDRLLKYLKESNINDFGYEQDKLISYEEAQILLDYMTNLQEEIERQSKAQVILDNQLADMQQQLWEEQELSELFKDKYEKMKENAEILSNGYNELEKRNEKAIEYIKSNEFYFDYKTGACIKGVIPLLNILNGGDDNE